MYACMHVDLSEITDTHTYLALILANLFEIGVADLQFLFTKSEFSYGLFHGGVLLG